MKRSWRTGAIVLALAAQTAAAQTITGTIRGTVTDSSGAIVPNAVVVVTSTDKHIEVRRVTANTSGEYVAPLLPVGNYEISVEANGFQRAVETGVVLNVGDRLTEDFKLKVGSKQETVTVNSDQLQVQLEDAQAESLISGEQVRNLPTNNRNYEQLVALQPGVSGNVPDQLYVGVYNYKNQTNVTNFSIGGGRDTQNNWTIDGADNVDRGSNRTLLNYPSVDAISEFKLLRGTYNAEYGRGAGGQVEVVTRSGTSQFHGSAYEFFRNDALDANSYIGKIGGQPRQPLRYNDFGGTIGGPVSIPFLWTPAKPKTFFFFSEELRRIHTPVQTTADVPTADMKNGIFPVTVCTSIDTAGNCLATGNSVTPNPTAAAYIHDIYSKLPNPGSVAADPFAVVLSQSAKFNYQEEFYRLDHIVNDRISLMGRFLNDKIPTLEPGGLFTNSNLLPVSSTSTNAPGKSWLGRMTYSITPKLYEEFGYAYSYGALVSQPTGLDNIARSPDVLPTLTLPYQSTLVRVPDLNFDFYEGITGFGQYLDFNRNHNVFDNLSWIRGNHSAKFGITYNHYNKNENSAGNTAAPANGAFTFDETGQTDPNDDGHYQNWANFLNGYTANYLQQSKDLTADIRENSWEFYGQDEWRPMHRLTFSYGLRYSLFLPPTDGHSQLTNFDPARFVAADAPELDSSGQIVPGTGNPLNGIVLGSKGSPYGDGVNGRTYTSIAPRFGVAFDPFGDGRTSLRGGFGIFQEPVLAGLWEAAVYQNPPYNQVSSYNSTVMTNPGSVSASASTAPPGLVGFATKWHPSYTEQFSLDVQRELAHGLVADAGYYGQHAVHLVGQIDINEVPEGAAAAADIKLPVSRSRTPQLNRLRPYPGYGSIPIFAPYFGANYNSLQTQITKRFEDGSVVTANYTWSHALTDNQTAYGTQTQDTYNPHLDYGPTQLDRKHIFNANAVYQLPFLRNRKDLVGSLLGGWQMGGIFAAETGVPLTVFQSGSYGDAAGLGLLDSSGLGSTSRPNLLFSPQQHAPHTFAKWFNTSAFAINRTPGQPGNEPRGAVRGPGFWRFDLSTDKTFHITERFTSTFRVAAYNLTNSTSFLGIRTSGLGSSSAFGRVTSTHDPRILQLALRLEF